MKKDELNNLINEAFAAPEPERKQEFLNTLRPREVGTVRMILGQIAYIGPAAWILAAAVTLLAIAGCILGIEETEGLVAVVMPFTAAVSVIETQRSKRFGMSELEMATRFSLRSVVFARMTLLGILSAIILCITSPVIAVSFGGSVIVTAVRILIPYLVTMIIGLHIERSTFGRNHGIISLAVAGASAAFVAWSYQLEESIFLQYELFTGSYGIIIAAVLLALTFAEQWRTVKNVEAFA